MTTPARSASPQERLARMSLSYVTEPGDHQVGRWLERYGAQETLSALEGDTRLDGATARRWEGLRLRMRQLRPGRALRDLRDHGLRFVCPGDAEWPTQLDDLGLQTPLGLWVRGTPSLRFWALRSVAVVGARACTGYGIHMASTLGADLSERGWTVVSGAAYGVDGAAHRGALAGGGATVAVLANGLDVPYPRGHSGLIARIAEHGLVVAELPPGAHPTRSRFVLRNRVIAALTRGTVVVEAELRSGSLVTARNAQALGRYTMGVPGPATSALSTGVHELLRGEGHLVSDVAEIIEVVGEMGELAPARQGPVHPRDALPAETAAVLEALPGRGGAGEIEIAREAGNSVEATRMRLHELRSLGLVEKQGDGWALVRLSSANPIE
ncbi:DNA-processing protein DprA [Streptomyces sp. NPDC005438]|uniref:DNA-processing protein DprA n=1 Tax=Streptomyces sp. NPDC005438 TaxID=3156880 RepID=UPI0033A6CC80